MLLLIFHAGTNRYALDTSKVVEVLPVVLLRKIHQAPEYVAGVFNYHGRLVPVLDLCRLIHGIDCQIKFSTRIILVQHRLQNDQPQYLGLMAEQVTETLNRSGSSNQPESDHAAFLGEIFIDEKGMIQRFHWESLIPDAHALLAESDRADGRPQP